MPGRCRWPILVTAGVAGGGIVIGNSIARIDIRSFEHTYRTPALVLSGQKTLGRRR